MATILKVQNAAFAANAIGFIPPIATGLKAWDFQGATGSLKNRAEGGADFSAAGSPTYGANVANLKAGTTGFSEINTSVPDSPDLTLFGVFASDEDGIASTAYPAWISCAGNNAGIAFYTRTAGRDRIQWFFPDATTDFVTQVAQLPGSLPFSAYRFVAATIDSASSTYTIYDKTNGTVTPKVNTKARAIAAAGQPFKFGNSYSSTVSGSSRHILDGIYNRALSAAEIEVLYQYAKGYCSRRGVVV